MEKLILYSTVYPPIMRQALYRGFLLGIVGILSIVLSAIFLNPSVLTQWGFFIFMAGFALMAIGLVPYRHLTRLATKPDILIVKGESHLELHSKGKKVFEISLTCLKQLNYVQLGQSYGIGLWPHTDEAELPQIMLANKQIYAAFGCTYLLPYFSKRSFEEIQEFNHLEDL
jgi:hypothetical protein